VLEEIGPKNLFSSLDDALQRARELVASPPPPQRIEAIAN
jgi:hypothetical protein